MSGSVAAGSPSSVRPPVFFAEQVERYERLWRAGEEGRIVVVRTVAREPKLLMKLMALNVDPLPMAELAGKCSSSYDVLFLCARC